MYLLLNFIADLTSPLYSIKLKCIMYNDIVYFYAFIFNPITL
jgi:hypothetical protein